MLNRPTFGGHISSAGLLFFFRPSQTRLRKDREKQKPEKPKALGFLNIDRTPREGIEIAQAAPAAQRNLVLSADLAPVYLSTYSSRKAGDC